jgi:suppressor for copper-sensitivity B
MVSEAPVQEQDCERAAPTNGISSPAMRCSAFLKVVVCLSAALAVGRGAAVADAAGPWVEQPHIRLRLSTATTVGDDRNRPASQPIVRSWALVEMRLDPGWKIYWRSPGDAGIPTTFDWSRSRNLAAAETLWPAPSRARLGGMDMIGYGGIVVFPVALRPAAPAAPVQLDLAVTYGICREICIPGEARLALPVPPSGVAAAGDAGPGEGVRAALERIPTAGHPEALRIASARREGSTLVVEAVSDAPFAAPDLFVEGPGGARFGAPAVTLAADRRAGRFVVPVSGLVAGPVTLVMTLVDGSRAFERRLAVPVP